MFKGIARLTWILSSVTSNQILVGIVGFLGVLLVVHLAKPPLMTVATVDVTGIVNQFVQSQVKLNLPAKELQQRTTTFGQQLQITLNEVAQKRHEVLLLQEAVVAGAPDVTPIVKQRLFQSLNDTASKTSQS